MAIAAIPSYVPKPALAGASPGLRFGMYLQLWGEDSRTHVPNWETADVGYRASGPQQTERSFRDENKNSALRRALALGDGDLAVMKALLQRQRAAAKTFEANGNSLILETRSVSPFTTGLGNEHPLENGFAFLNPYGLPYLPGSGVKGVLRQAARELCDEGAGWTRETILALFGGEPGDTGEDPRRGALAFWDVIPQVAGDMLTVDVMTPHQSHYYQKGATPHESGQPTPIHFLTVPPGSDFVFHVQCDARFLARLAPELVADGRWCVLLESAFRHAFDWLGFGAKTAVGYGAMRIDEEAAKKREHEAEQVRAAQEAARLAAAEKARRDAALNALPPIQRQLREYLDAPRSDKSQSELTLLKEGITKQQWSGELKVAAAERIKALMVEAGTWRDRSEKKNPQKDFPHQDTLLVLKWLKRE